MSKQRVHVLLKVIQGFGREKNNHSQEEKGDRMTYGLLRGSKEPQWRESSWVENELGGNLVNWEFK